MATAATPFDYGSLFSGPQSPSYPQTVQNPYATYNMNWSQGDPASMMQQDMAYFGAWGQTEAQQLAAQQEQATGMGGEYTQAANMEGSNILDTPGYTPTEQANITRDSQFASGETTADQFASLDPTAAQTAAMEGDPSTYMNYFSGTPAAEASNVQSGAQMSDDAITNAQTQAGTAMAQEGNTINDVFSNPNLAPSSNYYSDMAAAVDPSKLSLNLNPNYQMSDQEVQQMEEQAGETVASSNQARQDQIEQQMQASGTADPLAYAALSKETQGQTAEQQAQAVTGAQISAEDAQRQTEMDYAQANLSANQAYSGLALGETQQAENTALGAAQWAGQEQIAASENLAGQGVQEAQWAGGQGTSNANDYASLYQQALQYSASTGTSIEEAMNQAATQAATQQYGIQQGNTMYQQGTQFNQNYQTNAEEANLYQGAANARIAGQNTGLNWATGEQQYYGNEEMGLNQQEIGVAQATFPQMNTATGQAGQYHIGTNNQSSNPFMTSFENAIGTSLGSGSASGNSSGASSWSWGG